MKSLPNKEILDALRCPLCGAVMSLDGEKVLFCCGVRKHCYDLAASGYVNLMPPGQAGGGDSKQAVCARTEFLNLTYYQPVADALGELLTKHLSAERGLLIDAGCGEGYYTLRMAELGFSVVGADLSKFAVDAAAKRGSRTAHDRSFFSVSSVFALPYADHCAQAVINVFAPCAEEEFARVLRPDGVLAVVHAGPEHLMGLKNAIYETTKENDGRADLPKNMKLLEECRIRYDITVKGADNLRNLFAMTPYYWKTSPKDSAKLDSLEQLDTPVDMIIAVYRVSMDEEVLL